jgi:peptidoglycan hydrolase-like protein with peptidoglycan-binding domain
MKRMVKRLVPQTFKLTPYAELTVGSHGEEVLNLKQRLRELGYYNTDKLK